ncbi:MAG: FAD-binding oxidoreductase [Arenicellales bacterium]|nr:FAD-binding oxidoreductase [Arenicellales bacterium]
MTDFLSQVQAIVGQQGMVTQDKYAALLEDQRGYYRGEARMIVQPRTTEEVARLITLCGRYGIPVVPQGGNSGLCGGATPDQTGNQIVLCLSRMSAIREIDPVNHTATVEAGVILQQLHEAVARHDLFFPLDLGAKGSCQIGGNLSTNAGGINVLRYGNARELVLGLEVVLPDGQVWSSLSKLRKDNTGYDLKQLFIGAEGTLGIITAAVLKLFPTPGMRHTAFIAVKDPAAASDLFIATRRTNADVLVSFEYMPRLALDLVGNDPLNDRYEHYILLELISGTEDNLQQQQLEDILAQGLEDGSILDGTIAQNDSQRETLWQIRESISPAQRVSVKNDVSVPVSRVTELLERAPEIIERTAPGARPCPFGHIGDGNIHYNILGPADLDPKIFRQQYGERLVNAINDLVMSMGGSFSAEHGIGKLRRDDLYQYKDKIEIELMKRLKATFDPDNLLNPGKII